MDPTPAVIQSALAAAANSPGYPQTTGAPATRDAIASWVRRRLGARDGFDVLPTIGTKEFVAWLPTLLELGPSDRVVIPELAYPTYDVGARMAGAQVLVADSLTAIGPARVSLLWLNSPSNPTGKVLPVDHMAKVVSWARERGALVVSDECYYELGWTEQPVSVLHPDVCGGDPTGVLALHSLSKRSNLAGYRFGFAAGDPAVIATLLEVRKHAGMMVPGPVQAAAVAALGDDTHVVAQRAVYRARREVLAAALTQAGFPRRFLLGHGRVARRARGPGGAGRVLRPRRISSRARGAHRHRRACDRGRRTPDQLTALGLPALLVPAGGGARLSRSGPLPGA